MSYGNYNGFDNPPYTPPAGPRINGSAHSGYESPVFPSPRPGYDRYIPAQDDVRYRGGSDRYRPEGDSYRAPSGGDSYRPHDQWRPRGAQGDHYAPGPAPESWRPAEPWSGSSHTPHHERRSSGAQWEEPVADRMFEPSDAWVSSHASSSTREPESYPDLRNRDTRPVSPRRGRDFHGSFYAPPSSASYPSTPAADFYRPASSALSPVNVRPRLADSYRPGHVDASPSSYVPDAQPGPHWRGRTGDNRFRTETEGSHWEPKKERSFSGSPDSRSPGSAAQVVRNRIAATTISRSSSAEVSSPSRPQIQPSRPLRAPAISVDTATRASGNPSMNSGKTHHPSLPPHPHRDRTEAGVFPGDSGPREPRKRKTRRGRRSGNGSSASNSLQSPSLSPAASRHPGTSMNTVMTSEASAAETRDESRNLPAERLTSEPPIERVPSSYGGIMENARVVQRFSEPEVPVSLTVYELAKMPAERIPQLRSSKSDTKTASSSTPIPAREPSPLPGPPSSIHSASPVDAPPSPVNAPPSAAEEQGLEPMSDIQPIDDEPPAPAASITPVLQSVPPLALPSRPPPTVKTFTVPRPPALVLDALRLSITTQKQFGDPGVVVQPIYQANLELCAHVNPDATDPHKVEPYARERADARGAVFEQIKESLAALVSHRHKFIAEKSERLRKEYLERHTAWMARCADLDRASQLLTVPALLEEATTTTSTQRTTRRTAAVVGDTVRSDLEMEQIIASLGNEDMFDPAILATRNVAKIPDMLSVMHGRVMYAFDDTNHAVEDPATFYDPGPIIAAWTPEEEKIMLEQYAANPKQFGKIAEALPNKTVRECVLYYYLHKKKLVDFRKAVTLFGRKGGRRGARGAKKGNGLLADIRAHDAEMREESIEDDGSGKRRRRAAATAAQSISVGANIGRRGPRRSALLSATNDATPTATPTPEPEQRPKRARAAKQKDALVDDEGSEIEQRPAKRAKRGRKSKTADDDSGSVASKPASSVARGDARRKAAGWTDKDKIAFVEFLSQFGDDWQAIANAIGGKSSVECFSFYKANRVELQLDAILESAKDNGVSPSGSTALDISVDIGTPASEPPSTTAAPSAPTTPPTNGAPKTNQPVLGSSWPVQPPADHKYSSSSYYRTNGLVEPPMRPLT